ncbi:DUF2637 domain-containing protein [Mycolicibacterium mucogenicum]|uniref:DUF2637 domain-containing protein n=1 Tax=Mycolicibacterium mucogenicum TaxID=56689 RepID=UPI00226A7E62|nr:DUF2637 domain-containing protein [Mycolicibacterium mucogenicum]MCX8565134.1 DUF2637 domain-containing protein [Mycolicibacterium mucogenicum]
MASPWRARAFFWTVLFAATAVSIAANAAHARLIAATGVPVAWAAAVATVPPVVLLVATEGLQILVRTHQRSSWTYRCAVAMTVFLALAAFALSFFSLRDLAIRCGIQPWLAWLWPLVVDVCIAQCTVVLQALGHTNRPVMTDDGAPTLALAEPSEMSDDRAGLIDVATADSGEAAPATGAPADLLPVARQIVGDGATKQPPEVVAEVLRRHQFGERPGAIASSMGLHHSTVNRLLNEGHRRTLAGGRDARPSTREEIS